ncbi:MAG: DUF3892 domain-containing protein [Patescibacteria group bacterium]
MADIQVRNIRKKDRMNTHEHITHAGNIRTANWIWTREDVIKSIEQKTNTFYVQESGKRSEVAVVYPNDGRLPFLRTHADGYWNDNLLSLPEC